MSETKNVKPDFLTAADLAKSPLSLLVGCIAGPIGGLFGKRNANERKSNPSNRTSRKS